MGSEDEDEDCVRRQPDLATLRSQFECEMTDLGDSLYALGLRELEAREKEVGSPKL